ncbi:MAG TPA: hypothetical protein VFT87_01965, partial [Candidatus Saccharimonadales bacterium]|nr:hypothetical protein [Candidatus Saccharimonadales bacterium]
APAVVLADDTATNNDNTVTSTETKEALQDVHGILGSSDQIVAKTDADSAVVANVAGSTVDIPKDPEQGVTFGAEAGTKIEIDLPSAENAGTAKTVANGVVAYDSGNGSANAVQATEDGGVRMLTVIDNPNAPTTYDYKVTVPNGGKIELTEDGGAIVLDRNDQPISTINTPWAKDANEMPIKTWFTTDGQTLTQHVQHNVPGVVYPVTADPWWKNRFWSYVGCITGVGVPIGLALVIAALPPTWPALYSWGVGQGMNGNRAVNSYIFKVYNACGRFINS